MMRDPATIPHGSSTATPLANRISCATETVTGNEAAAATDGDGEGEEDGEAEVEWVRRCARWGRAAAKADASMVVVEEDELGRWKRTEGAASRPLCGGRRACAGGAGRMDGRRRLELARVGGWGRGDWSG
jgi:hypothetical protein